MSSFTRFIGFRYGFSRKQSKFSAFVSLASMFGMTLGVASLITVLSVMNGFSGELRGRILALIPHAFVSTSTDDTIDREALAAKLIAHPDVSAVSPFAQEVVLLQTRYRQHGASLYGIDPLTQGSVSALDDYMVLGDLVDLSTRFSVVLGVGVARSLGVAVGDEVTVILPQITVTPLGAFPRQRSLRVVGLFEVGAQQDGLLAYTSLETSTALLRRRGESGLQIRTTDLLKAAALSDEIANIIGESASYRPWSETQGSLFRAIRMEKLTVTVLLMSVVLVAAFNIVSTLAMTVTEKRADIAVLRTMGATPAEVARVFLAQGLTLSLLGVVLGAGLGIFIALGVADVVDFAERLFGARLFDPNVYYIARLPSDLQIGDVLTVVSAAVLISILSVLYPAWRASKVAPAEVLRYE